VAPAIMAGILIVVVAPLFAERLIGPTPDHQPPD
jgi:hypothetical protein